MLSVISRVLSSGYLSATKCSLPSIVSSFKCLYRPYLLGSKILIHKLATYKRSRFVFDAILLMRFERQMQPLVASPLKCVCVSPVPLTSGGVSRSKASDLSPSVSLLFTRICRSLVSPQALLRIIVRSTV